MAETKEVKPLAADVNEGQVVEVGLSQGSGEPAVTFAFNDGQSLVVVMPADDVRKWGGHIYGKVRVRIEAVS